MTKPAKARKPARKRASGMGAGTRLRDSIIETIQRIDRDEADIVQAVGDVAAGLAIGAGRQPGRSVR